jgi:energy-coupling factor transport system substrate-specific component
MSWQAASFSLLALVLVGGFVWYERSRPPSRLVALVAALAALAVAGRLVLAPVPNVVATTDIVLFAGYAIGGPPGFAVGALSALVSNFWLGQGPWTPWQMAGWGTVGLGGAALAMVTGRRLGRIGLAAACGLAGLAYGALLDLSVMVTYGGEQSLERYLALSARGVPFNLAHAAGNIALALVAGPALVRMLSRFRARAEFRWGDAPPPPPGRIRGPAGAAAASLLAAAVAIGASFGGPGSTAQAGGGAGAAAAWMERAQNGDGGFGTTASGSSSPAMTGWAMLGLEAAGRNPLDVRAGGHSAVDYLRGTANRIRSTTDIERTILALAGAGVQVADFGGRDLVAELRSRRSPDGSFQGQVNITAFGILALRAAGESGSPVKRAAAWLRMAQNPDGGWGFQPNAPSDPDSTGAALQSLAAAGGGGGIGGGVTYLRRVQEPDGGWALAEKGPSNSQSTAWAVQGLLAAGADPAAVQAGGRTPFDFLAARQEGDGHFRYSSSSDQTPVWVTGQALLAVEREPFPLDRVPRASPSAGVSAGGTAGGGNAAGSGGALGGGNLDLGKRGPSGQIARPGGAPGDPGAGPQSGIAGESPGSDPSPTPPFGPPVDEASDEPADAPFIALGLADVATVLGLGFLWYRGRRPI